jgi:hypothetical protein
MPFSFLLALQASGMVMDWFGKSEQIRLGRMGEQVEQAGINANIATSRLQTEEDTLASMKKLRQNLGTQAVMMAARGVGGPMGAVLSNESVGNFNADSRIRRLNQMGNEASLRAQKLMSNLHEKTFENNTWNEFRNNTINRIPTSPEAWNKIGGSFGLTKVGS